MDKRAIGQVWRENLQMKIHSERSQAILEIAEKIKKAMENRYVEVYEKLNLNEELADTTVSVQLTEEDFVASNGYEVSPLDLQRILKADDLKISKIEEDKWLVYLWP